MKLLSDELIAWIHTQNKKLKKGYHQGRSEYDIALAHTVKLSEEVGEYAEQVLHSGKLLREEKKVDDNLAEECADVIICSLLIADQLGANVQDALEKKVARLDERFKSIVV